MRDRGTFLRVGLLVIAAIGLLVGLLLFLGGNRLAKGAHFETYFIESVQGLEVGAPVKFRGVTIGRVTDIGLVSSVYATDAPIDVKIPSYRLVYVAFVIDPARVGKMPDNEMAVRTGLRTRIASQGLTGLAYIELDFVQPDRYPPQVVPWTPRAEYIPSMPSTLSQVQDAAQQFLARLNGVDINALTASVTGLIADLRTQVNEGDVHETLVRASGLLDSLNQTIQQANIPRLTSDLRETSASVRGVARSRDLRDLIANLNTASQRLAAAAARLPSLLAGLDTTARRAGDSTADLQQSLLPLLRDLQAVTGNLRDVTEALRQYPAQVLLGGPPPRERPHE